MNSRIGVSRCGRRKTRTVLNRLTPIASSDWLDINIMANSNSSSSSGGIGFVGLLTIVFIVLKLLGKIGWSWWWVLSPIWISASLLISILLVIGVVYLVTHRK